MLQEIQHYILLLLQAILELFQYLFSIIFTINVFDKKTQIVLSEVSEIAKRSNKHYKLVPFSWLMINLKHYAFKVLKTSKSDPQTPRI